MTNSMLIIDFDALWPCSILLFLYYYTELSLAGNPLLRLVLSLLYIYSFNVSDSFFNWRLIWVTLSKKLRYFVYFFKNYMNWFKLTLEKSILKSLTGGFDDATLHNHNPNGWTACMLYLDFTSIMSKHEQTSQSFKNYDRQGAMYWTLTFSQSPPETNVAWKDKCLSKVILWLSRTFTYCSSF